MAAAAAAESPLIYPEAAGLSCFPDSVLLHILSFLPVKDLVRSRRVSTRWRRLVLDKTLWKDVDLTPYKINSKILWHLLRRYMSGSLRSLRVRGCLHSAKKPDLLTPALSHALGQRCPGLRCLKLREADLRRLSYADLPPSLKRLELHHCEICLAWFCMPAGPAASLPQLEHLVLYHVPALTNGDLEEVCMCNQLRTLVLSGTYRLTDHGVRLALHYLGRVERLTLQSCNLTEGALRVLASHAGALRHLDLVGFHLLTDVGLSYLTPLKTLESLGLEQCCQLSSQGVAAACAALPGLRRLNLDGIRFRDQGISKIRDSLPDCVVTNAVLDSPARPLTLCVTSG
ncbi:F-box/LRR-repeat protein 12 [Rhinatrema bivittatum]|uniref:F-box/LRR-repeat protein 12 n=1 Tax=Rhinatrema bivittatum TaxID=194408 RepID=UPI001127EB63|nr:F-box/LRR-repeat protein 12 [Rhinatrema bivittatum]